ncbi:unnamed protein product [Gongylonema pulchrum]|uniref:Lysine-specific demethylase JMJ706-like n=1 Tax=Gongylonema pulchrum TaxID=637853 RepID=A0A183E8T2_9BILA|nr:unnamed protein product [Gongylonema pulchrum]
MVRVTSGCGTKAESEKRKKSAKLENDGLRASFGTKPRQGERCIFVLKSFSGRCRVDKAVMWRRKAGNEQRAQWNRTTINQLFCLKTVPQRTGREMHIRIKIISRSLSGRENSDVAKKSRKRTKSAVESDNDKPAVLSKNRPTEYAETSINKSAVRPKKIRFDENGDPIPVLSDQAIGGFERVSGTAYEKEALLELCNGEGSDSRTASKKLKRKKKKKVEESQKTKSLPEKLNAEFAGTSTNMRPKKIRFDEYGNPIPVKSGQEVSNKIVSGNDYVPGALLKFLNGEESDFMEGIKKAKRKEDVKSKKYQSAEVLSKKLATEDVGISADEKVLQPQLDRSHGSRDPASLKSDEGTSSG